MYVVTVQLQIKTRHIKPFQGLIRVNASTSLDIEPGCQQFDVCTDEARPGEFFLYEVYKGRAAFEAHLRSRHYLQFETDTSDMIESKVVKTFDRID